MTENRMVNHMRETDKALAFNGIPFPVRSNIFCKPSVVQEPVVKSFRTPGIAGRSQQEKGSGGQNGYKYSNNPKPDKERSGDNQHPPDQAISTNPVCLTALLPFR